MTHLGEEDNLSWEKTGWPQYYMRETEVWTCNMLTVSGLKTVVQGSSLHIAWPNF